MNAELAALADMIDQRLGNEHASRQAICEDVAARLRQLAAAVPAAGRDGCGGRLADALDVTGPVPAELAARRTAAAAVLADFRREVASAPLSRPPGREWMFRLADVLTDVLEAGGGQDDGDPGGDGTEPYCATCGEWAGMFLGMEGWHHFRGDPLPGGQRSLYDAGHAAVIAWCRPPGLALSPAGLTVLAAALSDAIAYRDPAGQCTACEAEFGGLCYDHAEDLDKTDAYLAVAAELGLEVDR